MSSHLTRAYLFLLLHEFHLCHRHTKHSSRNETLNSHHFLEEKHWKRIERKEKTKKKLRLTGTPMASGKLSLICACFFDVFKGHPLIQGHPPIPSENCVCYFVFASISLFFYFSSFCLDCFPPCSLFSCWRYIGEGYFSMSFQGQTASCLMDASLHRVSVEDPPSFIAPWTCEKLYHPT